MAKAESFQDVPRLEIEEVFSDEEPNHDKSSSIHIPETKQDQHQAIKDDHIIEAIVVTPLTYKQTEKSAVPVTKQAQVIQVQTRGQFTRKSSYFYISRISFDTLSETKN